MSKNEVLMRELGKRDDIEGGEQPPDSKWQRRVRDQTMSISGPVNRSQVIAQTEIGKLYRNQPVGATADEGKDQHQSARASFPNRQSNRFGGKGWHDLAVESSEPSGALECRRP